MPSEKQIVEAFEKVASDTPGYMAASLVDLESGMTLGLKSLRPDFDLAAASAYNSEMVKQKLKIMKALNLRTTLEDMLITLGDQIHVIKLVGANTFIYLCVDRSQSNLAIVRNVLSRHVASFTERRGDHPDKLMALIDSKATEIVIRLVYDGPPEAGKTTSLRALAGSLAQTAYTPGEAADGRTLWFDWMEYVGGRFEGCQIRCQIVSVPGQRELATRRRRLIESADVVVFVADSSAPDRARTLAYLFELREMLAGTRPPVGVILQANKRDLPDAIPLDELRELLLDDHWPVGVVESIAADGTGIREAFVYAVRLALDRVRELMNRHALPTGAVGANSADELLEVLRTDDLRRPASLVVERGPDSVAADLLREVLSCEHEGPAPPSGGRALAAGAPRPPDAAVPSGAIWPPVEGRAILCELAQTALTPRRLGSGDWAAGLGTGWRVVSSGGATFGSLDQGRAALIQWARLHAGASDAISPRRCIVLADDGQRGWRLWQIVRAERSLREAVDQALRDHPGESVIPRLSRLARLLLDADDKFARLAVALPCNLDCVGALDGIAAYIGLVPDMTAALASSRPRSDPHTLLRGQLEPAIAMGLRERALDPERVFGGVPGAFLPTEGIIPALSTLLRA